MAGTVANNLTGPGSDSGAFFVLVLSAGRACGIFASERYLSMKADTFKLARDIARGKWLVAYPDSLIPIARAFLSKMPVEMEAISPVPYYEIQGEKFGRGSGNVSGQAPMDQNDKLVAIVPIHGTMTKYNNCGAFGTLVWANAIKNAADKDEVVGIVLDIDSGGGSSSAVPPLLEAIAYARSKGKPIYAHADMCGSAAFWVASQCDAIYLDNEMSEIGSVGCYYVMQDTSAPDPQTGIREITVYSRKSSDKNLSYRKALEGDMGPAMDELDELATRFQEAVIAGRPHLKKDADGVLTGAMFPASKAIANGMADAVRTLDETIEVVFALAEID